MNNSQFKDFISSIEQTGVEVNHEALNTAKDKLAVKSIIIRVISILGSLLGLGLFVGFIAVVASNIFEQSIALITLGAFFLGLAFLVNKSKDSAITDSIAVSIYIIGYAFLTFGLSNDGKLIGYSMLGVGLITLFIYNNQVISFLSSLFVLIGIHVIMFNLEITRFYYLYLTIILVVTTYLFWQEQKLRTLSNFIGKRYLPIFTSFFSYTVVMGIISSTEHYGYYYFSEYRGIRIVLILVLLALILLTVHQVLNKIKVTQPIIKGIAYLIIIVFNVLVAYYYPAFGIAFLFILWSFKRQFKAGFVICIATFIWAMGMFYYDLGITLLAKSISLMIVGVLFLAIYYLIQKKGERHESI